MNFHRMSCSLGLCLAWSLCYPAKSFVSHAFTGRVGVLTTPVLTMKTDNRVGAGEFAASRMEPIEMLRRSHAASGLIYCGETHGAGQLTLANNVVTTAAHVLFDERGALRSENCDFAIETDGKWSHSPLKMSSIVTGAVTPYAVKTIRDWAVVELEAPLPGVEPYELAQRFAVNDAVDFVARGHSNWRDIHDMSFESCNIRAQTSGGANGVREFAFDCSTGDGSSGGAVLLARERRQLAAILVGWRSLRPSKLSSYSPKHYNFVISVEGDFRRAIERAAGKRETISPTKNAGAVAEDNDPHIFAARRSTTHH